MKFNPHKNNKEQKLVQDFDETFFFLSYEYFCGSTQQEIVGKIVFCNKTIMEAFLKNPGHTFLNIEKDFVKKNEYYFFSLNILDRFFFVFFDEWQINLLC